MATDADQAIPLQFFQIACGDLKELEGNVMRSRW